LREEKSNRSISAVQLRKSCDPYGRPFAMHPRSPCSSAGFCGRFTGDSRPAAVVAVLESLGAGVGAGELMIDELMIDDASAAMRRRRAMAAC